jgi:hypothetical protein
MPGSLLHRYERNAERAVEEPRYAEFPAGFHGSARWGADRTVT